MTIKDKIAAYHKPHLIATPETGDGGHVCQVWEDGEVTLSKGGSLWGMRHLHMIELGLKIGLPIEEMPANNGKHGYVVVAFDDRDEVRKLITDEIERRWQF